MRAKLDAVGTTTCPSDKQIAAHGLEIGVTLVSHNMRAFVDVPGFLLANSPATP